MALDLGDLVGYLVLDTSEFDGPMDRSVRQSEGFASRVPGVLGKAAIAVGVAMAAIGVAAAVGVGALIKTGVEYNAQMDMYETNLSTLVGSTELAKSIMQDLSSFAASTPFEMPALADASQTLLQFGISSQDLMGNLSMLGDISLGNSERMQGLALVFGQVSSAGRLMGQDVLQFINQGFNPLVEISKITGESMVDLKKRMEEGGVSFEEVRAAMERATSEGGQFFGAMEAGSKTFNGQISTLKDGLNILAGAITADLTDSLTADALPALNLVTEGLIDLVNGVDGAEQKITQGAVNLATAIETTIGPAFEGLMDNLGTVLVKVAPVLGTMALSLVNALVSVAPALIQVAADLVLNIVQSIVETAPAMIEAAVPILLSLVEGLLLMLPMLLEAGLQILITIGQGIAEALPTLIPVVVDVLLALITTLIENLPLILGVALEIILALGQGIIAALPSLIEALPAIIVGIISFLQSAIPMIINAGIELLMAIVGALPVIIDGIVAAIPQIVTGLILSMVSMTPDMIVAGISLLLAIIAALPTIISTLAGAMPQIVNGLIEALSNPSTQAQFARAGQDAISGLWEGIQSMWSNFLGWWGSAVDDFIGTFTSILGIASPSKVFRGFGLNVGQGLLLGLEDIQPQIDSNIQHMVTVPSTSEWERGTLGTTTDNTKNITIQMFSDRSELDEEDIFAALDRTRGEGD